MRFCAILALAGWTAGAATLTISPPLISECQNGYGVAQLNWYGGGGPVLIRVNQPDGPQMTGYNGPNGSSMTGPWVADGTKFFLVNEAGVVEATAVAHVLCGGTVRTIDTGLAAGSYFPLQVGNTWVYVSNNRLLTRTYAVWTITGTEEINGKTYFDLMTGDTLGARLRSDSNGVIWKLTPAGEQVYVDPGASAFQKISYSGAIGTFSDALTNNDFSGGLEFVSSTFVRGIGLAHQVSNLATGSSGGFEQSLDLIEVRLPGVNFTVPKAGLSLAIETADLDVTNQAVPNCALPCYFVACGLGGGIPDPTGTYRPCMQVRVESTLAPGADVQLQLLDGAGTVLFSKTGSGTLQYVRVPVYTTPDNNTSAFTVLRHGPYKLVARVLNAGQEVAVSSLSLQVR